MEPKCNLSLVILLTKILLTHACRKSSPGNAYFLLISDGAHLDLKGNKFISFMTLNITSHNETVLNDYTRKCNFVK